MRRSRGESQLALFPNPPLRPKITAEAGRIAAALPAGLRFGTSSWTFPGWSEILFEGTPSRDELIRDGLAAYAAHPLFRTVGIDRSYYAPLSPSELDAYAAVLPEGFLAVSKVWSDITTYIFPSHVRYGARANTRNARFLDPETTMTHVIEPYATHFQAHAGPFVFEIPPIPKESVPRPSEFARTIDDLFSKLPRTFRYGVELRNRELLTDEYAAALRAHGVAHVYNFWSAMPTLADQFSRVDPRGADFVVVRALLAPGARYDEKKAEFSPFNRIVSPQFGMRDDIEQIASDAVGRDVDAYVIVNNKAEGSAPLTVFALAQKLAERFERQRGARPI